jgi:hypothetical protein
MSKRDASAPFKRGGVHRLNCVSCDGYLYATVAQLEARGTPACWCGEQMEPTRIELAMILGIDDAPAVRELADRTEDKERAQLRSVGRGGEMLKRFAGTLNDMSAVALEEIRAEQRAQARERRLSGLVPTPAAMPF